MRLLVRVRASRRHPSELADWIVLREGVFRLGSGFEGDPVAHGCELGDVVAQSPLDGDSAGVVVGAEVVEASGRVSQRCQMMTSMERATATRACLPWRLQTPITLAEEGVGFGGRGGVLDLGLALDEGLRQGAVHGLGQRTRSSPIRPRRRRPLGGRGAGL